VDWIHNVGVPDAAEWLNGGELVLTTMMNVPETPDDQTRYILDMVQKDVAGLVITVGRHTEHVPPPLQKTAAANDFPLIEISFKARFVDIARKLNEQISQKNLHMVKQALKIHQTLTALVLEGGGLQDVATRLADLLGHSISIETDRFEAIATENIAEVDEARRYTQLHGRTDPRLVTALEQQDILPEIRQTLRPRYLEAMPDVGLEMERILAPIVVYGEIYGYMWIIADVHAVSDIDMMAIESGSTVAALMMLHQESVQSAEASLKGSLLSRLIQGDGDHETILVDQSLRYGVDVRSPYVMMLIECNDPGSRLPRLYRAVNQMLASEGWSAVAGQFAGQIVVLAQKTDKLRLLATHIRERSMFSTGCGGRTRIGVSGVQQGAEHVKQAYEQCQDVLHISRRLNPDDPVVYFDELGYLHTLYHAGRDTLEGNASVPVLRRLLDEKQADLFRTLEAYLDAGANGVVTAENLHIHRSTLNYRLQRINQICDIDLQDPTSRMNLQVALKLMRLFDVTPDDLAN
jgi:purine catabolism regulator